MVLRPEAGGGDSMSKCKTCQVHKRVMESEEPACCAWLLDNVVCGDKSVDDCPVYEEDDHA